jgi:hypothetical protein
VPQLRVLYLGSWVLVALRSTLAAPGQEEVMSSRIAGINVHKKTLAVVAVVVSEVEVDSECRFERGKFGGNLTNCDRSLHG